jgi:DNA polymerase III sliding clamp (beta) subunit (PCNA family)
MERIESIGLLKRIAALMPLASKDETRYHLNGVYIEVNGDKIHLSVTDGHKAIKESWLQGDSIEAHKAKGLLSLDQLVLVKHAIKTWSHANPPIKLTSDVISGPDFNFKLREVNYPNINSLAKVPKSDEVLRVRINAKYLLDMAHALNAEKSRASRDGIEILIPFDYDYGDVTIETDMSPDIKGIKANPNPWHIFKDEDTLAVVMPMRV